MNQKQRRALEQFIKTNTDVKALVASKSKPTSMPFLRRLMSWQRKLVEFPTRHEALNCGRRAGKTYTLEDILLYNALKYPGTLNYYITPTLKMAKDIIWSGLKDKLEQYSIAAKPNNTEMYIQFSNGSKIVLYGVPDKRTADRLRGPKYRSIVVDEAGSFGSHLQYLIEEVLGPALEDLDGIIYLSGTPNALCSGYFYNIINKNNNLYRITYKTVLDNSKFPRWAGKKDWKTQAKVWFDNYKKQRKWAEDNTILRREWLAQWIRDDSSLVIPFTDNNIYTTLPNENYEYAIGVDLGFIDEFAISILAYNKYDTVTYVVDSYKETKTLTKDKIKLLSKYIQKYNPTIVVADTGGAGKQFLEDFNAATGLDIQPAHKTKRFEYVDLFANAFRTGDIQINSALATEIEELRLLEWRDKANCEMIGADHFFDATLYIWRELLGRYHTEKPNNKKPTLDEIEEQIHRYVVEQVENEIMEESFYY